MKWENQRKNIHIAGFQKHGCSKQMYQDLSLSIFISICNKLSNSDMSRSLSI